MSRSHALAFRQAFDDRIEIANAAVYRFDPALPKPCFHPLTTPAGHVISGFEMSDHVWHRGLWFTIKFINGTNFWEEQTPFGVQVSQAQPSCELLEPGTMRITHPLTWRSEATGIALREIRRMTVRDIDAAICTIDWETELTAAQDVTLDRTPYTTWGGYGGLAFRAARELHDVNFHLPNGETVTSLAGQSHKWVAMQAKVDGGVEQRVSIAIFDHPLNERSPSPWYCKSGNGFNYMNPALLFHEPLELASRQVLRLRYRVMYRDGAWNSAELAALDADFARTNKE